MNLTTANVKRNAVDGAASRLPPRGRSWAKAIERRQYIMNKRDRLQEGFQPTLIAANGMQGDDGQRAVAGHVGVPA